MTRPCYSRPRSPHEEISVVTEVCGHLAALISAGVTGKIDVLDQTSTQMEAA